MWKQRNILSSFCSSVYEGVLLFSLTDIWILFRNLQHFLDTNAWKSRLILSERAPIKVNPCNVFNSARQSAYFSNKVKMYFMSQRFIKPDGKLSIYLSIYLIGLHYPRDSEPREYCLNNALFLEQSEAFHLVSANIVTFCLVFSLV